MDRLIGPYFNILIKGSIDGKIGPYFKIVMQGPMDRQIGPSFKILIQGSMDHQIGPYFCTKTDELTDMFVFTTPMSRNFHIKRLDQWILIKIV